MLTLSFPTPPPSALTGLLFALQWDGVVPAIMTLAKALGCGFPIGAMLAGPRVAEVLQFGAHGTTFGGNPLAAAVANVALEKLDSPAVRANVERQSQALRTGLQALHEQHALFVEIRGRGLMLGAPLATDLGGGGEEILGANTEE